RTRLHPPRRRRSTSRGLWDLRGLRGPGDRRAGHPGAPHVQAPPALLELRGRLQRRGSLRPSAGLPARHAARSPPGGRRARLHLRDSGSLRAGADDHPRRRLLPAGAFSTADDPEHRWPSGAILAAASAAPLTAMPRRGLEPPCLAALDPESSVSTNSTTWAVWSRGL